MKTITTSLLALSCLCLAGGIQAQEKENPMIKLVTSAGDITLELYAEQAPVTVENFLQYVKDGYYKGTVFHRVIRNFMIQGGGFDEKLSKKSTRPAIKNEAANGLKNDLGTVAMARTSVPDSATSQFFINTVNNASLNHRDPSPGGIGYCVFARVVEGMDIVDAIQSVPTGVRAGMRDVPIENVVILDVVRIEAEENND